MFTKINSTACTVLAGLIFVLIFIDISFAQIVIYEVMANPLESGESHDEYIELYNNSAVSIDVNGWKISDGSAEDDILAWVETTHGDISDPDPTFSTTIIPAFGYAVILDQQYEEGGQPYDLPSGCIILTTDDNAIGNYGLSESESVILKNSSDIIISTYGTPENPDDNIPLSTANGHSVEKKHPSIPDADGNWAESLNVNGTPGAQNSVYDSSLPVFLNFFSAACIQSGVLLRWQTESEVNNAGFYVCRSEEKDSEFQRISNLIQGAGNTNEQHKYEFIDPNVLAGKTYYYLLEDMDINGAITKHNPISVTFQTQDKNNNSPESFKISPSYPNPFGAKMKNSATSIRLTLSKDEAKYPVAISIYNVLGQRVYQFSDTKFSVGNHIFNWSGVDDLGNILGNGTYFWVIQFDKIYEVRRVTLLR